MALAITEAHARGERVALMTFTLRHTRAQRLSDLLQGLSTAWSHCRDSKVPRRLWKAHSTGWIKRLEVTVGPNGWHPHLHVLVFLKPEADDHQVEQLAAAAAKSWEASLVAQGLGSIDPEHGVTARVLDLATAHEKVAEYVAKSAALELANPGTKTARQSKSRTPIELLRDLACDGLADDHARWREYEQAMRGKSQIRWSQGLRARLLGDLPEMTDQQASEATDGASRLLGAFDKETWRKVCRSRPGPASIIDWAEVLDDDDQAVAFINGQLARHELGTIIPAAALQGADAGPPPEPKMRTEAPPGTTGATTAQPAEHRGAGGPRPHSGPVGDGECT